MIKVNFELNVVNNIIFLFCSKNVSSRVCMLLILFDKIFVVMWLFELKIVKIEVRYIVFGRFVCMLVMFVMLLMIIKLIEVVRVYISYNV